jgi:hypothetical protein
VSTELSHNGLRITVSNAGKFETKIGSEVISAPSMAALRKKLDKMGSFPAFTGFVSSYNGYKKVKIVALQRNGRAGYRNGELEYIGDNGEKHHHVVEDTAHNAELIAQFNELKLQREYAVKKFDDSIRKVQGAMTQRSAVREKLS